jgi:hypothetical protein
MLYIQGAIILKLDALFAKIVYEFFHLADDQVCPLSVWNKKYILCMLFSACRLIIMISRSYLFQNIDSTTPTSRNSTPTANQLNVVGKRVPGGWGWSTFYSVDKLSIEK